jgi:hypothetical protein
MKKVIADSKSESPSAFEITSADVFIPVFIFLAILSATFYVMFVIRSRNTFLKIICPNNNCRYNGKGIERGGKSPLLTIILLCLFIIPGIIYLMRPAKRQLFCPKCGLQIK